MPSVFPHAPRWTAVLPALFLVLCVRADPPVIAAGAGEPPRLAVVISVDQMRADYLDRFRPWFTPGGFERFHSAGAVYAECRYGHSVTKTAPGHATLLTGAHPAVHGVIANEWLDPRTLLPTVGVEDAAAPLVGRERPAGDSPAAREGRSPRNLLASTVGDQLELRHAGRSRVFSASNKDRAAILMGGKLGDSVYWMEGGRFVTSTYYRDRLPGWVEAFNQEKKVEAFFGRTWDRVAPADAYDRVQGPDAADGEGDEWGLGRTFPRVVDGGTGAAGPGPEFHEAWYISPFSSEVLAAFVKEGVRSEGLGKDDVPDLLCIGFSQIDAVGHFAGPDSHEMMDSMLRLDRILADLFEFLNAEVGLARCVFVLCSDHGCAPLPERVRDGRPGIPAGRVRMSEVDAAVGAALTAAFGDPGRSRSWCVRDNEGYRFRPEVLREKGVSPARAASVARNALAGLEPIAAAYTRDEILGLAPAALSPLLESVRHSFHPGRSQDVVFATRPYYIIRSGTGGQHGAPWEYDTHVPLAWLGPGIAAGRHLEPVGVVDLAPTLAAILGVSPPPEAQGRRLF